MATAMRTEADVLPLPEPTQPGVMTWQVPGILSSLGSYEPEGGTTEYSATVEYVGGSTKASIAKGLWRSLAGHEGRLVVAAGQLTVKLFQAKGGLLSPAYKFRADSIVVVGSDQDQEDK